MDSSSFLAKFHFFFRPFERTWNFQFSFNLQAKSYSYAITAYDGVRSFRTLPSLLTGHQVCSLVACTNTTVKRSCGQRFRADENVKNRINIERLDLTAEIPAKNQMILANTVTTDILPLNPSEYQYYQWAFFPLIEFSRAFDGLSMEISLFLDFFIFPGDNNEDLKNKLLIWNWTHQKQICLHSPFIQETIAKISLTTNDCRERGQGPSISIYYLQLNYFIH